MCPRCFALPKAEFEQLDQARRISRLRAGPGRYRDSDRSPSESQRAGRDGKPLCGRLCRTGRATVGLISGSLGVSAAALFPCGRVDHQRVRHHDS
jgi:hypothetical protein